MKLKDAVCSHQKTWPTPTKQDGENDGGPSQFNRNTPPLNAVVKTWPTPKRPTGGGMMERTTDGGGIRKLEDAISQDVGYPTGQLNPDWVEWLMGWPIGWSSLEPMAELKWLGWETDPADTGELARVATDIKDRVGRLKAIGNGQVPLCAATAWRILTGASI